MSRAGQGKPSWLERRKQARRAKAERMGDTPQKQAERQSGTPLDSKETTDHAGTTGGIVSGGFGGS